MAPLLALINPLSLLTGLPSTVKYAVLGVTGLVMLAGLGTLWMRYRRRLAITDLGRQRGLGEETSGFLGRLFAGEGLDAAETMMAAPELLRARLARELRRRHRVEAAQEYAERAARLLEELNSIAPPFPGAPTPFQQLALQDAADPHSEIVTAWVLSVDERNISIISRDECVWPMRRELLATPPAGHGEPFRASLLLRPVPPRHEWVLTHDLVDVITNRRAAVRVSCNLPTHVLPDSGDTVLLRERLADQETVPADELRRLHGWAQRHAATVLDVSSDGCRVELEHEVALRDRFHVLFIAPDDRLAGMPLAEVVSLQRAGAGRVTAGVRFIGMRLKERTRLAEFVRGVAAAQGKGHEVPYTESSRTLEPVAAPREPLEARNEAGSEFASECQGETRVETDIDTDIDTESEPPRSTDASQSAGFASAASAADAASDSSSSSDAENQDEGNDEVRAPDADERRRMLERLGLGPKPRPNTAPPRAPEPVNEPGPPANSAASDDPFEYRPRFASPFGKTGSGQNPPPEFERPATPVADDSASDENDESDPL